MTRELAPREKQVMKLVADGLTSEEAAKCLGLSPSSTNLYLSDSRMKLGATSTASAVAVTIRNGYIQ